MIRWYSKIIRWISVFDYFQYWTDVQKYRKIRY